MRAPSSQVSSTLTPIHTIKPSAHLGSLTTTCCRLCPVIQSGIWRHLEPFQFHSPLTVQEFILWSDLPQHLQERCPSCTAIAWGRGGPLKSTLPGPTPKFQCHWSEAGGGREVFKVPQMVAIFSKIESLCCRFQMKHPTTWGAF